MSFMAFLNLTDIPAVRAFQILHFYFSGSILLNPVNKTS